MRPFILYLIIASFFPSIAFAEVCDYRPSHLIGNANTVALAGGSGSAVAAGITVKSAGFYTITNATTGAVMLGSTATGTSAAGTVGIIGGSAGVLGTVGSALMSPFLLVPAAVATISIGVYEGGCYLID